jgi:hypothetical protein
MPLREENMKTLICFVFAFCIISVAVAGEIYGTITDSGKPVPAGIKVEITVAGKSYTGETDKFGAYHVVAQDKGKGALTAYYKDQKPSADVFSSDKDTRYDWTIEIVDGKMILKRK